MDITTVKNNKCTLEFKYLNFIVLKVYESKSPYILKNSALAVVYK